MAWRRIAMKVGIPKEIVANENRVALVPGAVGPLLKAGMEVLVQCGAGEGACILDCAYEEVGAALMPDAGTLLAQADVLLKVQKPVLNASLGQHEVELMQEGAVLIAFLQPLSNPDLVKRLAERKITSFSMDCIPRIARAQKMDALSSQSTVAGYKAALIAASHLPKFFPLLMTAAGTMTPARVFVIGAGVAGLQAIGTAKRLGAVVEAYDMRPAVKEQVESLGAKFMDLGLETKDAEDKAGYAKAQSEEFYKKQQQMMLKCVAAADVVITTALVPGQRAPVLITEEMVQGMRPGSVIVDLASEQGGNCALTEPGQEVVRHGVVIIGTTNLPSTMPLHASQMYARNVTNFLMHLLKDGSIHLDLNDELTRGPLVTHQGEILHEAVKTTLSPGVDGAANENEPAGGPFHDDRA
jgi:NAD(P) transhydrogenase subunit alpha